MRREQSRDRYGVFSEGGGGLRVVEEVKIRKYNWRKDLGVVGGGGGGGGQLFENDGVCVPTKLVRVVKDLSVALGAGD